MCRGELRFRMPKFCYARAHLLHNRLFFFDIDLDEETDEDYDLASDFSEDPLPEEEDVVLRRSIVLQAFDRETIRQQRGAAEQPRIQEVNEYQIMQRQQEHPVVQMMAQDRRFAQEIRRREQLEQPIDEDDDSDFEDNRIRFIYTVEDLEQREVDRIRSLREQTGTQEHINVQNTDEQNLTEVETEDSDSDDDGIHLLMPNDQADQPTSVSEREQCNAEEQSNASVRMQEHLEIQNTNERNVAESEPEILDREDDESQVLNPEEYLVTITKETIKENGEEQPGTSTGRQDHFEMRDMNEKDVTDSADEDLIGDSDNENDFIRIILRDEDLESDERRFIPIQMENQRFELRSPTSIDYELIEDIQNEDGSEIQTSDKLNNIHDSSETINTDAVKEQAVINANNQDQIDLHIYNRLDEDLAISSSAKESADDDVVECYPRCIRRKKRTVVCKRCSNLSKRRRKRSHYKNRRRTSKNKRARKPMKNKRKCCLTKVGKRRFKLKCWRSKKRTILYLRDRVLNAVRNNICHMHGDVQNAFEDYSYFKKTGLVPPNKK